MVKTNNNSDNKIRLQKDLWNEADNDGKTPLVYGSNHGSAGLRRSNVKSSKKWAANNQKTDPKHKTFTPQEEDFVIQLHATLGSRWPIIAQQLPGKTDNDVKILWNSKLRKKLSAMGIDPVTHKPFSQILADYGNIGAFPKARTRFGSLSRDLRNAVNTQKPSDHHHQSHQRHYYQASDSNRREILSSLSDDDHHHHQGALDLYSQFQAVNLVTDQSMFYGVSNELIEKGQNSIAEHGSSSDSPPSNHQETSSSFSWSDFLLEDPFLPTNSADHEQENTGMVVLQSEEKTESYGGVEGVSTAENVMMNSCFEASSSSSNGSSFLEAMINNESQEDDVFANFPGLDEEPFYF